LDEFDAGFNLFTSFGYFDSMEEDILSLRNARESLKSGGVFIQDYINAEAFVHLLPQKGGKIEQLNNCDIEFRWEKRFVDKVIIKDIWVKDGDKEMWFQEKVRVYSAEELLQIHNDAGFKVDLVLGDYELYEFSDTESPRIIVFSTKQ